MKHFKHTEYTEHSNYNNKLRNQLWNMGLSFLQSLPWQIQLPNTLIYEV